MANKNNFTKTKLKDYIKKHIVEIEKRYEEDSEELTDIVYESLDDMNTNGTFDIPAKYCRDQYNVEDDEAEAYFKVLVEKYDLINYAAKTIERVLNTKYDYDDAVTYIENHDVGCDPCSDTEGDLVCDLLDDMYDGGDPDMYNTWYLASTLNYIIREGRQYREEMESEEDEEEIEEE